MGLSVTASHVIWFFAFLGLAGGAFAAFMDVQEAMDEAHAARRAIEAEQLQARLHGATFCYDEPTQSVLVNATNVGGVMLDVRNVTFVVDGQVVGAASSTGNPEDVETSLWPPGDWANFTVPVAAEPDSLVLATQHGVVVRPVKVLCPYLASIVVTPASLSMTVGGTQDFSAEGFDQFGDPFPVATFSWSTDAGSVTPLTASTARLAASTTAGAGRVVTAFVGAVSGSASITLVADAPATITVTPSSANVQAGSTQAFAATAYDQHGNVNATATVSWSTNGGSITGGGLYTAQTTVASGRTVTATSGAASGQATVNVVPGAVDSVVVSPSSATVNTTRTQAFTATLYDAYGNVNTSETVSWSATRGSVTTGGLYTAPATVGADAVTATANGKTGQASVSVIRTVHVTLFQTYKAGAATASFNRGDTVETRVTVVDHDGLAVSGATAQITMTSPIPSTPCCTATTTNAGGMAFFNYTIPNPSANRGTWTDALTALSGTGLVRDMAADVATTVQLTVS